MTARYETIRQERSDRETLLAEQVSYAHQALPPALVGITLNSLLLTVILWGTVSPVRLLVWLGANSLLSLGRFLQIRRYRRSDPATPPARQAGPYLLGLAASGCIWGAAGIILFPAGSTVHQIFLAFILGGNVIAAAASTAGIRHTFLLYCLPTILPLSFRCLLLADAIHFEMGILMLLFALFAIVVSYQIHAVITGSITARLAIRQEMRERQRAEEELRAYQDQLEQKVAERTADLTRINHELKTEIGRRHQTEEALRESEAKFRRLVENLRQQYFFYAHGPDGVFSYVSPSITDILGYSQEEFLIHHAAYHTDNPVNREVVERTRASLQGIQQPPYLVEILHKDGLPRLLEVTEQPVANERGDVIAVEGIARDITEQRRTAEALRREKEFSEMLINSSFDGILAFDRDYRHTAWNPAMERISGLDRSEVIGRNAFEIFPFLVETGHDKHLADVLAGETAIIHDQKFIVPESGREGYYEVRYSPIRSEKGEVIGGLGMIRDITETRKLQQEVLKTHKLESLGVFAGGIAHDFNNILTGVVGYLSLARGALPPDHAIQQPLARIEQAANTAKALTHQLLTFSKGGAPVTATASLGRLIEDSAGFTLRGTNVRCSLAIPADLWPAEIDEGQISQVIQNLVRNAAEAMPKGGEVRIEGANVTVDADHTPPLPPGRYVRVRVVDHGCGIRPADQDKIFDPFFTTKPHGNGLGLAICYSIVRNHGGHITAASEPGAATTFTVHLPAAEKAPEAGPGPAATARPVRGSSRGRILLMDDERLVRDVGRAMLTSLGFQVDVAEDGEQAVALYQQAFAANRRYDLAIMDLTIPGGMGGEEALRLLRDFDPEVRAVVSSGYSVDAIMANFRDYGFCGVLPKPYTLDSLARKLDEILSPPDRQT